MDVSYIPTAKAGGFTTHGITFLACKFGGSGKNHFKSVFSSLLYKLTPIRFESIAFLFFWYIMKI
jgi:hypothetical protein